MRFGVWILSSELLPEIALTPICMVAKEVRSQRTLRIWKDELHRLKAPPYPISERSLFVAYYASSEILCHMTLRWPVPKMVLDLFTEFRNLTNGLPVLYGNGLLGALESFGLKGLPGREKEIMRQLAFTRRALDLSRKKCPFGLLRIGR